MKTTTQDITIVIIAESKGSRLNNQDQGFMEYRHQPNAKHILHQLKGKTEQPKALEQL